jgi:RNA polymerase sigma-70 factor (ECF subfamily)
MSRFERLTYTEIADKLEISVKTVESHISKALKTLTEKLKGY